MLQDRLREHAESAKCIRRRAETRIDRQFAPLRKELMRLQVQDRTRLDGVNSMYPDNSCYEYDRLEPRVFSALEELLRNRIAMLYRALAGGHPESECTSSMIMSREEISRIFGDPNLPEEEIRHLIASCADAFLPAFRLSEVSLSATYSYEDTDVYLRFSIPTFP